MVDEVLSPEELKVAQNARNRGAISELVHEMESGAAAATRKRREARLADWRALGGELHRLVGGEDESKMRLCVDALARLAERSKREQG